MKKILILRLSSIGDILLSSPFVRQVRRAYPKAKIDFVVKAAFSDLVKYNPHIDKIIKVHPERGIKGLIKLKSKLKTTKYDLVFDLHNNFRTKYLSSLAHRTFIQKDKIKRALLVKFKINKYTKITPIAERYLQVGQTKNISDDGHGLELFWKDKTEKKIQDYLFKNHIRKNFIAFAPGAAHFTKRWPIEYFEELAEKISQTFNIKIVLFGSKQEREYFKPLEKNSNIANSAGKLNLLESAALLNRATVLVSNDSGLMHMATAVNTPLIAIFGSTVEELGFLPYRSESTVIQKKMDCRPCSHIGRKSCPKRHFKCMLEIVPQEVFNQLKPYLEK